GPGPFTLSITRSGGGTVADSLGGIFCDERCSAVYAKGTQLTLTSAPDARSRFLGWAGDCTGTGSCSLRLDSDRKVAATFSSCPGAVLWSRGLGGGRDDQAFSVAVDASGSAVVVGSFEA